GAAAPSERGDDERELARLSGLERAQERGANASARHVLGELERRAARVGVLEERRDEGVRRGIARQDQNLRGGQAEARFRTRAEVLRELDGLEAAQARERKARLQAELGRAAPRDLTKRRDRARAAERFEQAHELERRCAVALHDAIEVWERVGREGGAGRLRDAAGLPERAGERDLRA